MTINVNSTGIAYGYIFEYETYIKTENGTFVSNSLELSIDPMTVISVGFYIAHLILRASSPHQTSRSAN